MGTLTINTIGIDETGQRTLEKLKYTDCSTKWKKGETPQPTKAGKRNKGQIGQTRTEPKQLVQKTV